MKLGERVRKAREHAKLSQSELAKIAGVKQSTISDLESGESKGTKHLHKIAYACSVRLPWLADESGEMLSTAEAREFEALPHETQQRIMTAARALLGARFKK